MRWFAYALAVCLAASACRDHSTPRVVADDARPVLGPRGPVIRTWNELAVALEPCIRKGRSEGDTRVRLSIAGDQATVLEGACWGDTADPICIQRTIEDAIFAGELRDKPQTVSITRRAKSVKDVVFGPVRVRTNAERLLCRHRRRGGRHGRGALRRGVHPGALVRSPAAAGRVREGGEAVGEWPRLRLTPLT